MGSRAENIVELHFGTPRASLQEALSQQITTTCPRTKREDMTHSPTRPGIHRSQGYDLHFEAALQVNSVRHLDVLLGSGEVLTTSIVACVQLLDGGQQERLFFILKTPKNVHFLSTAFAPLPLAPDPQNTRRAPRTRRPPESDLTGHKISPDATRQKARHSKWNCSEHLNRRQPTRKV